MKDPKTMIAVASFLLAAGVAAGAFGAHGLKNMLTPERLQTWETAVQYHVWHALGILVVSAIAYTFQIDLGLVNILLLAGITIFSGSLYLLCLTDTSWLGAITPIGGLAFIAGWVLLGIQILRSV